MPSDPRRVLAGALDLLDPKPSPFVTAYHDDPASFARECIDWGDDELTEYQAEILDALGTYRRVATRGPHGLGKTTTEAIAILWFALTRDEAGEDWKIPTTAAVSRQLTEYLWPEVHKWAGKIRWDVAGRAPFTSGELLDQNLKLRHGHAFAATSTEAGKIEGAHADELLFIYTEAKIIPTEVFDASEGAFSGAGEDTKANAYALVQSTPGPIVGRFYELHARYKGYEAWHVIHVTKERVIAAGRMSAQWAAEKLRQWGAKSSLYLNRVEGQFASDEENAVIPLAWVEAAVERWRAWDEAGRQVGKLDALGIDVAHSGRDVSVIAQRHGPVCLELYRQDEASTTKLSAHAAAILRQYGSGRAIPDVQGVGAGVYDDLVDANFTVIPFSASAGVDLVDATGEFGFLNKRAAAWWRMRELLNPSNGQGVCLPPEDMLMGDLTAPTWWVTAGGKIQVESKDQIRKRLGRSTDDGDAVVQAYWVEPELIPDQLVTASSPVTVSPY